MEKSAAKAIPNELFSYEIKHRHWTDRQVAAKILELLDIKDEEVRKKQAQTDEDRVKRWRRGVATPSPYFQGLLEKLFGKKIEQLGWPGKNKIPHWKIDDPQNPLFTGREEILDWLHDVLALRDRGTPLPIYALTGLAGVGKSQAAIEYAHKFKYEYHTIVWLRANTRENLAEDFAAIASHIGLDLPEEAKNDQKQQIDMVKAWLNDEEITRWLLIFDSADDPAIINDIIRQYVPEPCQGHVIITTRSSAIGLIEQRKEVDPLSIDESVHFLLRRAKIAPSEKKNMLAKTLAEELGGLPLALEQAGAYIEVTGCGLDGYQDLYRKTAERKELLEYQGAVTSHVPIAITLSLTFQQVQQVSPLAFDLLALFAFYAPDYIPEELLHDATSVLSPVLQTVAGHPKLLEDSMGILNRYSLIHRFPDIKTCSIHPLVQVCIRDIMDENTQRLWAERAIKAIFQILLGLPLLHYTRYSSHAQKCLDHMRQRGITTPEAVNLLYMAGQYLQKIAKYNEAEPLLLEAHRILEIELGSKHIYLTKSPLILAELYTNLCKYSLAEDLLQQALSIREQILGSKDPAVSECLLKLGLCYLAQSMYEQAAHCFRRCVKIDNLTLDANDPRRILALYMLRYILKKIGDMQSIEDIENWNEQFYLLDQVRKIANHAGTLEYLAKSLSDDRFAQLSENQNNYERTLAEHPYTAELYYNLARIYEDLQDYKQAEKLYLKAIAKYEVVLSEDKLPLTPCLIDLGLLYLDNGKSRKFGGVGFEDAETLFHRAFTIGSHKLGTNNIITACAIFGLAAIYIDQERFSEGKTLLRQSLTIHEETLGVNHPATVLRREEYIALLQYLMIYDEVKEQEELLPLFTSNSKIFGFQKRDDWYPLRLSETFLQTRGDYFGL